MGQRRRLRQNSRGRNGGRRCIERPKWVRALVVELWRPQTKGEDGPTHRLSSHPLLPLTTLCSLSSLPSSSSLAHFLPHAFRLLTSPSVLQMVSAALVSSADVTPAGREGRLGFGGERAAAVGTTGTGGASLCGEGEAEPVGARAAVRKALGVASASFSSSSSSGRSAALPPRLALPAPPTLALPTPPTLGLPPTLGRVPTLGRPAMRLARAFARASAPMGRRAGEASTCEASRCCARRAEEEEDEVAGGGGGVDEPPRGGEVDVRGCEARGRAAAALPPRARATTEGTRRPRVAPAGAAPRGGARSDEGARAAACATRTQRRALV